MLLILSEDGKVEAALVVISSADGNAHGQLETAHRAVLLIVFLHRLDLDWALNGSILRWSRLALLGFGYIAAVATTAPTIALR